MRKTLLTALLLAGFAGMAQAQTTTTTPAAPTTTHHSFFHRHTTAASPAAPATTAPAPATATAAPAATTAPRAATAMGANQFSNEAQAKLSCAGDTVVWANTSSKAYHMAGDKYYGNTKRGAYMCQRTADSSGFHLSGQHAAKPRS
jgi:hypothetical protein